jgi:Mor family transcriptional regulator
MNTSKAEQPELFDALTCDPLDLIERGGEALAETSRWPQRLQELFDIELRYSRRSMDEKSASADAGARTILIADYLGGSSIYLPRGDALRQAVRDAIIYARYKGQANHDELAREFGMTSIHLYEVIAREKRRQLKRRQGRLFQD